MARRNVALASNGGTASASSSFGSPGQYPPAGAINGDRTTTGWGSGGGWAHNGTSFALPAWLQIDFPSAMLLDEIDVITFGSASDPTLTTTDNVSSYGASAFTIEYWDGAAWQSVTSVAGNIYVWRQFTGLSITTTAIRVTVTAAPDNTARLLEVEVWGDDAPPVTPPIDTRTTTLVLEAAAQTAGATRASLVAFETAAAPLGRTHVTDFVLEAGRQTVGRLQTTMLVLEVARRQRRAAEFPCLQACRVTAPAIAGGGQACRVVPDLPAGGGQACRTPAAPDVECT